MSPTTNHQRPPTNYQPLPTNQPPTTNHQPPSRSILLVRLRLIGDVVFTTPLLRALRRRFPGAHLTYLVEPAAEPVIRGNPHLDEIIVIPRRRGVARWRDDLVVARRLRRRRFDVAIDLHGGPRSAWLTRASGAAMRIGYTIKGRAWMYTHPVARAADLTPRHSVVNQWDLLAPLGITDPDPMRDPVEMTEDLPAVARVEHRLQQSKIDARHALVVIHVSAGNPFRRWPQESFVELIVSLVSADSNRRVVLTSGPSDAGAARAVAEAARRRLGARAAHVPETGEFDLAELRALVGRSAVYIGGDSGPLHVAATTMTPIVALFGPTLPERSMPWRGGQFFAEAVDAGPLPCRPCRQRVCEPGDFRCLTGITPRQVAEAAERALSFAIRNAAPCGSPL
jgi:lipopolysaccharide heptosyltransferase II